MKHKSHKNSAEFILILIFKKEKNICCMYTYEILNI